MADPMRVEELIARLQAQPPTATVVVALPAADEADISGVIYEHGDIIEVDRG